VILVGGMGTRLGNLTQSCPKPLLPVAGMPFLDYLIEHIAGQGIHDVILLAGWQARQVIEQYDGVEKYGVKFSVVVEETQLGTGGALTLLEGHVDNKFALMNGDTLFDADIQKLGSIAGDWQLAMSLRQLNDTSRSGVVTYSEPVVTGFQERGSIGPGLVNGGVYVVSKDFLEAAYAPCSLEADIFPSVAAAGKIVGKVFNGFFIDIGVPDDYEKAQILVPNFINNGIS